MKNIAKAILKGVIIAVAIIVITGCSTVTSVQMLPDGTKVTVSTTKTDMQSIANAVEVGEKLIPSIEKLAAIWRANQANKSPAVEEPAYTPPK